MQLDQVSSLLEVAATPAALVVLNKWVAVRLAELASLQGMWVKQAVAILVRKLEVKKWLYLKR